MAMSQSTSDTTQKLNTFIRVIGGGGGIQMIDKIIGIATGTDKKNQTFYKVRFQSGLEASTWNQDHFPHLITGNEVDITISETE